MLAHEWHELEALCDRISSLRHRLAAAHNSQNVGLVEGLKLDIARARRQRELLVQHISTRLGTVTARHTRAAPEPIVQPT